MALTDYLINALFLFVVLRQARERRLDTRSIGALRGETPPGVADLQTLVAGFRRDLLVRATLTVQGQARALPAETGLVLYRGVQEALTNIARYSPGALTTVVLRYEDGRTCLSVENAAHETDPDAVGVEATHSNSAGDGGVGGGHGLVGLAERVERVGGALQAGPHRGGWRVELQVPA